MIIGAETFFGSIETTRDALLILEAARQGILNRVNRRISHEQKNMIRHGSVFVFDERESKMKRWTDTRLWTPSRINGNFLIYREAEDKLPKAKSYKKSDRRVIFRQGRKEITGSKGTYAIKPRGLIKRTLSVQIKGATQHLVSYQDPYLDKLSTPRDTPSLQDLQIGNDLLYGQGFRRAVDQNGDEFNSEEEDESRDRTFSSESSIELHSVFDSVWTQNEDIVNGILDFESTITNDLEMMKSEISVEKLTQQPEIPCSDYLDIEEITKELFGDDEIDDAKMPSLSIGELNFEEFLLMENTVPWN